MCVIPSFFFADRHYGASRCAPHPGNAAAMRRCRGDGLLPVRTGAALGHRRGGSHGNAQWKRHCSNFTTGQLILLSQAGFTVSTSTRFFTSKLKA